MLSIHRILFPTDFSEPAEYAWPYALTFAQEFGAELHLLHVITPPPRVTEAYAVDVDPERTVHTLAMEASASLDQQVEVAKSRELIFCREVRLGVDYREIIDYASKHEIDLIVMATHGRTGLAHVLLGSVAEKVVRKAPCPVLTIKHPTLKVHMA
jgi:universal stress protein A